MQLLPEEFEDSLEETQPRFSGLERIEEESDDPLQTPMERDSASAATTCERFQLTQNKKQHLERHGDRLWSTAQRQARNASGKEVDAVLCQCGWNEEEGEMVGWIPFHLLVVATVTNDRQVACSICGTWQHPVCYGYTGSADTRLPMEHVCYQCLLGETEAPLLAHFKSVALQRKGMRIVQEDGFYSTHQFAEYLRP